MILVTNINLTRLLAVSGFGKIDFSTEIHYNTLGGIISTELKDVKSAEVYWEGDTSGICDVLTRNGIIPVASVNKIQSGMKILEIMSDDVAALIDIKYMR